MVDFLKNKNKLFEWHLPVYCNIV